MKQHPTFKNIHNRFLLNGNHYRFQDLFEIAYSFIKEGEDYERAIGDFLMDWIKPNPTIQLKTSGSTGVPKIISYHKQAMVNSAIATGNHFNVKIGDSALHCLNADFIAGKMMLVRAMILGLEIDLVSPLGNVLRHSAKQYDFAAMVPIQVEQAFEDLNRVKTLLIGGTPSSTSLKNRLKSKKTNCFETYGMTETLTHIASREIHGDSSAFTSLPGVNLSTDQRNCLVIDVPYLNEDKIITNDLVELLANDKFKLKGRVDNVINSGGIKVIPEEIEEKLSTHISESFFVAGVPDDHLGEKVILVIEGVSKNNIEATIQNDTLLGKYEKPKIIRFVTSFKRTPNGKIQRKATLERLDL